MKSILRIQVLFLCILISFTISAQEIEHEAPTLQVGLDGLNFTKGTLDPEIIARIIAQKQSEIKLKIIQNTFLKNIYGSGGTIYNYADNVIKGVVQEPDTDVRTKKIMESTVNLVFVYAFADFYLKQVSERKSTELDNLQELAKGYKIVGLKDFKNGLKYKGLVDKQVQPDKKGLATNNYSGLSSKPSIKDDEDYLNQFMALIIDISSEVVRNNPKLRDLGLMRVSYSSNYDYLNLYKQQQNYLAHKKDSLIINKGNLKLANTVYDEMNTFMEQYTSYIGALKYIIETKSFKSNDMSSKLMAVSNNKDPLKSLDFPITSIDTIIKNLSVTFNTTSQNNKYVNQNYLKDLETAIQKLTASLNYIKKTQQFLEDDNIVISEKVLLISDMLYTLKFEVIPNIEYSVKFAPDLLDTKDKITALTLEIYTSLVNQHGYFNFISQDPAPFLQLVSKLYEFDKTKTFSEYTKLISLLDEVFETGKINDALSTINTFVKDYTEITVDDEGNEALVFNVESFLVKLENLQSDKIRRFQFHFTVGMNTTSFLNGNIDLGNQQSISNLSHFSEKIGLKFKLMNRGDWMPKNPGESYRGYFATFTKIGPPKEPFISNWHLLLYGSGILYTVINSSTNEAFDYPMVGFGTGLTFYNALDFNISIGIPLLENGGFEEMTNNPFVSFGFDIQIGEYLKEVGKKRKAKKINEQLLGKS